MAEEEKKGTPEEAEGGEKKSQKKLFIIIGAVILVLGLGAGGYFFLMGGDDSTSEEQASAEKTDSEEKTEEENDTAETAQKPEGEGSEGAENSEPVVSDVGATFSMKPFHLNLGNPLKNNYIQIEIALEYKGGENHKKEIELRLSQIRDAIIGVISRKTREFLLSPDGKDQLKLETLNQVNQFMDRKIEAVYIGDMLIE